MEIKLYLNEDPEPRIVSTLEGHGGGAEVKVGDGGSNYYPDGTSLLFESQQLSKENPYVDITTETIQQLLLHNQINYI